MADRAPAEPKTDPGSYWGGRFRGYLNDEPGDNGVTHVGPEWSGAPVSARQADKAREA